MNLTSNTLNPAKSIRQTPLADNTRRGRRHAKSYTPNGAREVNRRLRQIASGQLRAENGLVALADLHMFAFAPGKSPTGRHPSEPEMQHINPHLTRTETSVAPTDFTEVEQRVLGQDIYTLAERPSLVADAWARTQGGESRWTKALREFDMAGGMIEDLGGTPNTKGGAAPMFYLILPDGHRLTGNEYRLKDIQRATAEALAMKKV